MVFGIVKSHEGYIMCYSEPGEGTTFKIYFPIIEQKAGLEEPEETEVPLKGGTETILLVEDDETIRNLGEQMLGEFGYTVLTATDGENALELYRIEQARIDLIILDLIMPGMGGRKCLEELIRINPQTKVLIASGYSANARRKDTVEAGAKGLISKPYDMSQMLNMVREILDED